MSEPKTKPMERMWLYMVAMAGHELDGARNLDLKKAVGVDNASTVTRDLTAMEKIGVVERLPWDESLWRLSPKIIQIAHDFDAGIARADHRRNEVQQRYTRKP